jgi:hypothetical protein
MTFFRRLFAGCWRAHGDQVRERRGVVYVLRCVDCGDEQAMFTTETIKGPRLHQEPILGRPTTTVLRVFEKRKVS